MAAIARIGLLLSTAFAALAFTASDARAHPHVWIDVSLELRFESQVLRGMRVTWVFDEYYSAFAVQDFDSNGNGKLDAEELAVLDQGHEGLGEYSYFTHLKVGNGLALENLKVETVENFKASMMEDRLVYAFDVPLPEGLNPRESRVGVGFYDETYYIDLNVGSIRKPRIRANWPGGCEPVVLEDTDNPIYFGMVNPLYVQIRCDVS